jgi:hypothetical protein
MDNAVIQVVNRKPDDELRDIEETPGEFLLGGIADLIMAPFQYMVQTPRAILFPSIHFTMEFINIKFFHEEGSIVSIYRLSQ